MYLDRLSRLMGCLIGPAILLAVECNDYILGLKVRLDLVYEAWRSLGTCLGPRSFTSREEALTRLESGSALLILACKTISKARTLPDIVLRAKCVLPPL